MEKRRYAIPLIALGLSIGPITGCLDTGKDDGDDDDDDDDDDGGGAGIVGSWDLVSIAYDGYEYPLYYSYQGEYYTYVREMSATLDVASDLSCSLGVYQSYSYGQYSDSASYSYDGTVTDNGGGSYGISVPEMELSMDCTLGGSTLTCDNDGGTLTWQK